MQKKKIKIERALLSCSDKAGLVELARALVKEGVEIISTGGTKEALVRAGISVTPIEKVTGNPEAFGGRMKTISFQVESALLWRRFLDADAQDAQKLGVGKIDLVVCNLYPFAQAVKEKAEEAVLIENIDIGGPTMIRAAAKNYEGVCVLTSPEQYSDFLQEINQEKGHTSFELRRILASQAFLHTARYEAMIAGELAKRFLDEDYEALFLGPGKTLRYGENPHQQARYFSTNHGSGVGEVIPLQGKEISYNNLLDADAAWKCASDVCAVLEKNPKPVVVIVKHLNPCGVASGASSKVALEKAWACDPISSFGGILCFSHEVDQEVAQWLSDKFVEVIVAPHYSAQALKIFSSKKNLRLLALPLKKIEQGEQILKSISGGILWQDEDEGADLEVKSVTAKAFPAELYPLAQAGIMINKHLKSNAIALVGLDQAGDLILAGAGMGQPNRIESLKLLASVRAKDRGLIPLKNCVLISDAFFPFADSIESCHEVGVQWVVQPGGSIRDGEVIAAADRYGMGMLFTGRRHFRH